tara:strand:+ start:135 stop:350 length:216 start_codon:yes stop_codon:yes gene_type:complete
MGTESVNKPEVKTLYQLYSKEFKCNQIMPDNIPLRFRPDTNQCALTKGHTDINHMTALGGDNWNLVFYWRQ